MPQEPVIIDTTIIQVKSTTKDNYGNLIVTPVEGDDVRIAEKRKSLFDIFQEGATVKLFWAEYKQIKYVAKAELGASPPPGAEKPKPESTPKIDTGHVIAPPERGMWWKEIGENFRAGLFKKDGNTSETYLWGLYIKQMLSSLEITLPVKSKLVEEVKKIGGKED